MVPAIVIPNRPHETTLGQSFYLFLGPAKNVQRYKYILYIVKRILNINIDQNISLNFLVSLFLPYIFGLSFSIHKSLKVDYNRYLLFSFLFFSKLRQFFISIAFKI